MPPVAPLPPQQRTPSGCLFVLDLTISLSFVAKCTEVRPCENCIHSGAGKLDPGPAVLFASHIEQLNEINPFVECVPARSNISKPPLESEFVRPPSVVPSVVLKAACCLLDMCID